MTFSLFAHAKDDLINYNGCTPNFMSDCHFIELYYVFPTGRPLPNLCVHLFQLYGLLEHFNLDPVIVWKVFCKFTI